MLRYFFIIFLLLLTLTNLKAFSQNLAFKQFEIGLTMTRSVSGNHFTQSWSPSPGVQLGVQTPFYTGLLEGGIRYTRFIHSKKLPSYSDFHSTFIYLGWGYLFEIGSRFSTGPVLRFGNTFMLYDEAKIYTKPGAGFEYNFDTEESEFTYELLLHNEYKLSNNWKVHAELAYNRTLTHYPLRLTFITLGFSRSFDSPSWLQKVLK